MDQIESSESLKTPARSKLPTWVVIAAFGVLAAFLAVIGFGMNRTQQGPITPGSQVPAFPYTTFDGEQFDTADFSGKVIVINFWASWCKPCEQEAADLEQAWQYYKDSGQVVFIGLNWSDTETAARGYLDRFAITYPNGPDLGTRVSQMFRIAGVPETYIIGRDGRLAYVKKGPFNSVTEIQVEIDRLLN